MASNIPSYDSPGYKNPLGKDAPSWSGGSIDWKGGDGGINWNEPSWGVQKEREQPSWYDAVKKGLQNTASTKRQEEENGAKFGSATGGSAGQVLENLGVIFPQQHAPVFIPGQQSKGKGGTIGSIVGMIGGAVLGGPAGAALGGQLGGAGGSLFD
jgi:hypothetical protein